MQLYYIIGGINMQKRFDSTVAWASIVSLIFFVFKNYGLFSFVGLTPDTFREVSDLLLAILIAFGIFNNPTDADGF